MTAPATAHTDADVERFLMGGGGAPDAFKLIQKDVALPPGTTVSGVIMSWKMEQQRDYYDDTKLVYWQNGDPRMQLVVTVQTDLREPERYEDDEGERRFFVKGEMQKALRAALEAAGKRTIERGGRLTIQLLGKGTPKDAKSKAPNLYSAHYQPPEVAQAEQFLAQGEPAAAPPVPPVAGHAAAQVLAQPAAPMQVPGQAVAQALDPQYQAQQLLAAQLGAAPLAQPQAVQAPAPPVVPAAAPTAPGQVAPAVPAPATAPPGLPPEVAAALAALSPEQRADALSAMGVQQ